MSQLQKEIKDLQSSVKELAKDARRKRGHRSITSLRATPQASTSCSFRYGPDSRSGNQSGKRAQEAYERGRREEELKSYGPAIEAFTEAVTLDPKNDSAFLHRGYSHYYLGDYASSVSDITRSIELQPHNSRAYAMRAQALACKRQGGGGPAGR